MAEPQRGPGLQSIRWRFALASALLAAVGVTLRDHSLGRWEGAGPGEAASLLALVVAISAATFWMAQRLTGLIAALQRSTEAIAAGDLDAAVDVDCACEIGGLANSFRKMTARLNANVMRINTLAHTDTITGLPNRSVIDHMLGFALSPERRSGFRAAIVFIDLDGFKRINDTLGHDGGDELLQMASERILHIGLQRSHDTIDTCMDGHGNPCQRLPNDVVFARFAGDEFVAILPGVTDRRALAVIGQRIVDSLDGPFRIKGHEVRVGASVGMAIAPEDTTDASELIAFADLAMYSSKQAGKSCYRFFDKQVRELMLTQDQTEHDLRLGLDRGELVLQFQPKLDAGSLAVRGVEALVRWQHPERGLLAPAAFIDIAERSGLMARLGQQVLSLAVQQARRWLDAGQPFNVAVNVSPSQFSDPGFVDSVLNTLEAAGLPHHLLSIEITESMAMTNFDTTIERLQRLRTAGVMVALDDFGIGYSNLSQLSRLPLDMVKIDRSLVMGIGHDAKREAIIRAIVGMSHALGCCVVAEGIETRAHWLFLRDLGCDGAQGFLFARPMNADAVLAWRCPVSAADLPAGPAACWAPVQRAPAAHRASSGGQLLGDELRDERRVLHGHQVRMLGEEHLATAAELSVQAGPGG